MSPTLRSLPFTRHQISTPQDAGQPHEMETTRRTSQLPRRGERTRLGGRAHHHRRRSRCEDTPAGFPFGLTASSQQGHLSVSDVSQVCNTLYASHSVTEDTSKNSLFLPLCSLQLQGSVLSVSRFTRNESLNGLGSPILCTRRTSCELMKHMCPPPIPDPFQPIYATAHPLIHGPGLHCLIVETTLSPLI